MIGKTSYEGLSCPASTKNQLTTGCLTYDAAGNVTWDGSLNYLHDLENRMTKFVGSTTDIYLYDGDGQRVKKTTPAVSLYWYGATGNVLDETSGNGTLVSEYIFFNGTRVARRDADNTVKYYFADDLGSASVITNDHGAMTPPLAESDYYPYGGEIPITSGDLNHYKFTGKERDAESGLDMFGARYYASNMGRFMTPDWSSAATAVPYADFGNPQSLNLYSYTKNNPTTLTDPNGHCNVDGERHGAVWCKLHKIGITETQKEQADQARADLSSMRGLLINGKPASLWAKTATNQQLISAQSQLGHSLALKLWTDLFSGSSNIPMVAGVAWTLGAHKSPTTWQNQMNSRGWTPDQITEAIEKGEQLPAPNEVNPGNTATRYV